LTPTTIKHDPPQPDEIEVSVFGPGVGECIVVHLGNNDWAIVDSCRERRSQQPVALVYLERLGVNESAVKLIVATHWHDDHVRGLSDVLSLCPNAEFACSAALNREEFFTLVGYGRSVKGAFSSGIDEFSSVLDFLKRSSPVKPSVAHHPARLEWASSSKVLFRNNLAPGTVVTALSPSSATQTSSLHDIFGHFYPKQGSPLRRFVSLGPNRLAVVLWIEVGSVAALLGADLEHENNPLTGWQAIVESNTRPVGEATIFKVPHHGSKNADNPDVWKTMLSQSPVAAITPFTRSRLPKASDLARLDKRTKRIFCCAQPGGWSPPTRGGAVDKMAQQVARNRLAIEGPMGHVRIRCAQGSNPTVKLFSGAFKFVAK
jgi:beta-lactamase superfamily II metal-dependent hydrolase